MRRSPKSDPQRNEVYRWEQQLNMLWFGHGMTVRDSKILLRAMAKRYGLPAPALKSATLGHAPIAYAVGDSQIIYNREAVRPTALLLAHEFAHNACFANGVTGPDHGPIWLGTYIDLLDWFKILPRCMTEPSARAAGLKFKDPPF